MNQFFSLPRFSLLVAKHWADNKKRYGLSVLAFIILLIGWFILLLLGEPNSPMSEEAQLITFMFSLVMLGAFYASQYFGDLGSKPKGTNFLMVPASTFEKFLCSILFTVFIYFIVFVAAFYLADFIMVTVCNMVYPPNEYHGKAKLVNVFQAGKIKNADVTIYLVMMFFSIQSAFLLGSVYFSKFSFLKTVISGFAAFFLLFCLVYFIYENFMPRGEYADFFTGYHLMEPDGTSKYVIRMPEWTGHMIEILTMYAVAPFLWIVTYYRLKEKQV